MADYNGSAYGFLLVQTVAGPDYSLVVTFTSAPPTANVYQIQYRVIGSGTWISSPPIFMANPGTYTVPGGNNEYQIQLFYSDGTPFEYIDMTLAVVITLVENYIHTPKLNPLIWYPESRATSAKYQTAHIDDFPHDERGQPWMQGNVFQQLWQTTDIIWLQFFASFDPITIELLDENDFVIRSWVGLNKIPNRDFSGLYLFEFGISLAGLDTGCYYFRRILGSGQVTERTKCQYISSIAIPGTIYIEYKNSRFIKDMIFETGIKPGIRVYGYIDYDKTKKERKDDGYRNQRFTTQRTNAKSTDKVPIYFGDEMGLPAEMTTLIEEITGLDEVSYDSVYFTLPPDKEFDYTEENSYRMRGMRADFEPGLTRYSRITKLETDTQKRLMYSIAVDQQALSDTTGQGNNNVVPIFNVVIQ